MIDPVMLQSDAGVRYSSTVMHQSDAGVRHKSTEIFNHMLRRIIQQCSDINHVLRCTDHAGAPNCGGRKMQATSGLWACVTLCVPHKHVLLVESRMINATNHGVPEATTGKDAALAEGNQADGSPSFRPWTACRLARSTSTGSPCRLPPCPRNAFPLQPL